MLSTAACGGFPSGPLIAAGAIELPSIATFPAGSLCAAGESPPSAATSRAVPANPATRLCRFIVNLSDVGLAGWMGPACVAAVIVGIRRSSYLSGVAVFSRRDVRVALALIDD